MNMMNKPIATVIVGLQLLAAMMTITTTTNVFVSSFSLSQQSSQQRVVRQQLPQSQSRSPRNSKLSVSNEEEDEPEPEPSQGLIFGDAIESEMNAVKGANEYDFGQIDYLALAKQRAANKPESNNNVAGDDEWMNLAAEKEEQFGKIDDWENSQKEAGNADSQSLLMFNTEQPTDADGEDGDDNDEPKLLLL
ncbi:hypothetical protein FRACYDRAFT_240809 [Fragilariopsis cylindrus CCMP1102]|uniref:Uncharacterized protein n=1 Tax=Fragilariopsis cylindrus CCMP1102 TaxID=635003 RepID=A0A1E7F837_9STRA|nr:hypothetical protein FRACYDRAFT_240809 [Fragilariopsis cylindrus CCMP1102]|eukprot:OEU14274.1 hypothetical protein FRACYDRAFT_240809 [Fragilariopsis cylindrus CCMP1102]